MRLPLGILLTAGLVSAQTFEVHGRVVDPDLKSGIEGVEVTLSAPNPDPLTTPTTTTDSTGAFQFHTDRASTYWIRAKKDGYRAAMRGIAQLDNDVVTLSSANPAQEVNLFLTRPGDVSGVVSDPDGKPVAGFRVSVRPADSGAPLTGLAAAVEYLLTEARAAVGIGAFGVTDQDGYFTTKQKLPPGDYVLHLAHPWSASNNLKASFSEADLSAIDEDLEEINSQVHVVSGATVNAGRLALSRRVSYYRAHVRVRSDGCAQGERWIFQMSAEPLASGELRQATVDCSPEFLVTGLAPGSYNFTVQTPGKFAHTKVEITRGNVDVDLSLNPATHFTGRVVAAQDAMLPPLNTVRVGGATPNADGGFAIANGVLGDSYRLLVSGLPKQNYVKEVRYNGVAVPGMELKLTQGPTQQIEIVVDDKAGAISGSVTDSDQPVAKARVLAVKWPVPSDASESPVILSATSDGSGTFQIGGLAPGEYRVLALLPDANPANPEALTQIVGSADKVSLDPSGSQNVTLKLVRP